MPDRKEFFVIRSISLRVSSSLAIALLSFLALGALGSCTSIPERRGATVETHSAGRLEMKNPIDIVVAPVENTAGVKGVPIVALRESFQKGLVKRRYSPLALEYVDRKVVNAAYRPGSLNEEAVLQITVEQWDTSLWDSHSALNIKVQARMLDAANPGGGDLWSGRIDRRFELGPEREQFSTEEALVRHACEKIAAEVLAALPARNPEAGLVKN